MPNISAAAAAEARKTIEESTNTLDVYEAFKSLMTVSAGDEIIAHLVGTTVAENARRAAGVLPASSSTAAASRPAWSIFLNEKVKSLSLIAKLTQDNWHVWLKNFRSILKSNKQVSDHLFGDAEPSPYVAELDTELVSTIRIVCDLTGPRNVSYIVDKDDDILGRALFRKLRDELTKADVVTFDELDGELTRITMIDNDIDRLLNEIHTVCHKADLLGRPFTERERLLTLRRCTQYSDAYSQDWRGLRTAGRSTDFEYVCNTLRQSRYYAEHVPYTRQPRQAALAASTSRGENGSRAGSTPLDREKWLRGRVDPRRPNAPPQCYNCGREGHISAVCPEPKQPRKDQNRKSDASPTTSAKAASTVSEQPEDAPVEAQASIATAGH